jgi:hypothetical protein
MIGAKMSITYQLDLGASTTPKAVAVAMAQIATKTVIIEQIDGNGGKLRGDGWFSVDISEYDPPDPVEESFGFTPRVEIHFGLNKFNDPEGRELDVIRLTLGVLDEIPGDALFHSQHNWVFLLRRGGRLTINDDDDIWTPGHLALLPQSYERAQLDF